METATPARRDDLLTLKLRVGPTRGNSLLRLSLTCLTTCASLKVSKPLLGKTELKLRLTARVHRVYPRNQLVYSRYVGSLP